MAQTWNLDHDDPTLAGLSAAALLGARRQAAGIAVQRGEISPSGDAFAALTE